MPTSIWDAEFQAVLDRARTPGIKRVRVGQQDIEISTVFPSPEDWRDHWIYFLMTDRFNRPESAPQHQWDEAYGRFQGGTFVGIQQQLAYLQGLGVGALWISPVLKNCSYDLGSYHGYGAQDFLAIDPRFASDPERAKRDPSLVENELRALIDEAHARGMYVIFDIVLHHAGNVFSYTDNGDQAPWRNTPYAIQWHDENGERRKDWSEAPAPPSPDASIWPVELRANKYVVREGNAFDNSGKVVDYRGDFYTLKSLSTDFQDDTGGYPVRNALIRAYTYLIAKYDVDGFRIDTLMYISPDFERIFANAIREYALSIGKENFFTYGEVYSVEEQIARFIGRNAMEGDTPVGVDAALDFPLFSILPWFAKGSKSPSELANVFTHRKQVEKGILSTHGDASNFFVTFLDNHDRYQRFGYLGENPQAAFSDQISLGLGCLFTLQGIPCLYYGTEQGLSGHGDAFEAVREALWGKPNAFTQDAPLYRLIQRLTNHRKTKPALRYGRQYMRPIAGDGTHFQVSTYAPGVVAYSRILNDQEILIVANANTNPPPNGNWRGQVIVDMSLNPEGSAYQVLFSNKRNPTVPQPVARKAVNTVQVTEVNGAVSPGPVHCIGVDLQPMEIQILERISE